jgi:tRNA(fMet)-specific endonuclease VapC
VTTYLLDTNACVECLRNRNAGVVARFQACSPRELRLCSVVVAELCYGAYKSPKPAANLTLVQTFAAPLISVPFDDLAADVYGRIRADLEQRGQAIGPNDTMIAAIALANGLTIVTHNTAEFSRVSGLLIEDWHT